MTSAVFRYDGDGLHYRVILRDYSVYQAALRSGFVFSSVAKVV